MFPLSWLDHSLMAISFLRAVCPSLQGPIRLVHTHMVTNGPGLVPEGSVDLLHSPTEFLVTAWNRKVIEAVLHCIRKN